MQRDIGNLVQDFEDGRLSRRQLVAHLTGLVAAAAAAAPAAASSSTFHGVGLNHIALDVTDVARSRDFYVKHLGMEVSREGPNNCFLTLGENFVALFRNSQPGMNHYCYSVKDYKVDSAAEKLRAQDLEPRIQGRRIYFRDPDGLTVQLAAPSHAP